MRHICTAQTFFVGAVTRRDLFAAEILFVGANSVRPLLHNIVVGDFVIICNIAIAMLNKTAHKEKNRANTVRPYWTFSDTVI